MFDAIAAGSQPPLRAPCEVSCQWDVSDVSKFNGRAVCVFLKERSLKTMFVFRKQTAGLEKQDATSHFCVGRPPIS